MTPAQSDQILMQPPYFDAALVQLNWWRAEFGTYRVVAADPLLFDPVEAELVAGVDAGSPPNGHEEHQGVSEVFGTLELAGDAGDVVIADEGQRRKAFHEIVVAPHCPVQLVEVSVVEAAPDRLPQFILGDRVEAGFTNHRGVVTVYQFSDEPRVRLELANSRQNGSPKLLWHSVSSIQPPAVSASS